MMKNIDYIKAKQSQRNKNSFLVSGIRVFIKDQPRVKMSVKSAIELALGKVPSHLLGNIESINVGLYPELQKRKIQAMFKNSSIYITSEQSSEQDILDDIIHEVAHSVEETFTDLIYADNQVKDEFLSKRKKLWFTLKQKGFDVNLNKFLNPKYDEELDFFFYEHVKYPLLSSLSVGLFYSPYACTSLREYFENGFEAFFMREEIGRLKTISPALYGKIIQLQKGKKNV